MGDSAVRLGPTRIHEVRAVWFESLNEYHHHLDVLLTPSVVAMAWTKSTDKILETPATYRQRIARLTRLQQPAGRRIVLGIAVSSGRASQRWPQGWSTGSVVQVARQVGAVTVGLVGGAANAERVRQLEG